MGCAVGDFNNDGFDDLYVTSIGPDHLFKNNGNGTFTDVAQKAGVSDPRFSTGAAFLDYDNDGTSICLSQTTWSFDLNNLPPFGEGPTCQFKGIPFSVDHVVAWRRRFPLPQQRRRNFYRCFEKGGRRRLAGVTTDLTLWAVTSTVMDGSIFSWPMTPHLIFSITTMVTARSAK
jgi:hypothetical protein